MAVGAGAGAVMGSGVFRVCQISDVRAFPVPSLSYKDLCARTVSDRFELSASPFSVAV